MMEGAGLEHIGLLLLCHGESCERVVSVRAGPVSVYRRVESAAARVFESWLTFAVQKLLDDYTAEGYPSGLRVDGVMMVVVVRVAACGKRTGGLMLRPQERVEGFIRVHAWPTQCA